MMSRKTKLRFYTDIIRPIVTYGYEFWTTTKKTEKILKTFDNKVYRQTYGRTIDGTTDYCRT